MTSCILPWINFGTNTFGRARVCGYSNCKSDTKLKDSSIEAEWNNDYFKSIRQSFINGEWPENCSRCKYVEDMGGSSKRMSENLMWEQEYSHLKSNTNIDGAVNYSPPHIDIRTGTICNLKCIHCGTGASSKWSEDTQLLNKYPNTEIYVINNQWIEKDNKFWEDLAKAAHQTVRYNFLGGESFANKRHNEFIYWLSESEFAKNVNVSYVSNGTLINPRILSILDKFKSVKITISVDANGLAGEYFRYPLKWDEFVNKLTVLQQFIKRRNNFDVGFQWTASNVSMFYLVETYHELHTRFPDIKFIFCNHVTDPIHMSPQNLPTELKNQIVDKINAYKFIKKDYEFIPFYISNMLQQDLWKDYGVMFMQYLNDLNIARNIKWQESFKEMGLEKYEQN